jgi:dipeptidase E
MPEFLSHIILAGGGTDDQAAEVYRTFTSALPSNRFLFLPHASAPHLRTFAQAWDRIADSPPFRGCRIEMWENLAERSYADLDRYDGICLFGGNTYDLLATLRETGFAEIIVEFATNSRPVLGISAGAIVLGRDITTEGVAWDPDRNFGGITDLRGLDLLGGYNVHCHYQPIEDDDLCNYLARHRVPFLALPESAGALVAGTCAHSIGPDSVHLFRNGVHEIVAPNDTVTL